MVTHTVRSVHMLLNSWISLWKNMLWIVWGSVKWFPFERKRVLLSQDYRKTDSLNQDFSLQ